MPYTLSFETEIVRVEPMSLIEGRASGELDGVGIWRLAENDGVVAVHYTWKVRTTKVRTTRWSMNLLAPVAGPSFRWNHDYVMRNGAVGLTRLLEAELLEG